MAATHIVTLGDASITTDDLALLVPPCWMNDGLIAFWFEYLHLNVLDGDTRVTLLLPSIAYLLCVTEADEMRLLLAPLDLPSRSVVLIPVNSAAGDPSLATRFGSHGAVGSHWSLVVYERTANRLMHFDSGVGSMSRLVRNTVAPRMRTLLGASNANLETPDIPSQTNGYDCGKWELLLNCTREVLARLQEKEESGAYVCIFAERIVRRFLSDIPFDNLCDDRAELPSSVVQTRQEIGKIVARLVDENDRHDLRTRDV